MLLYIIIQMVAPFIIIHSIWNQHSCAEQPIGLYGAYQRNDSHLVLLLSAHHGVALPRSGLSVGKDADVVAFEGVEQHLLPDVPVHLDLGRIVAVLWLKTPSGRGGQTSGLVAKRTNVC